MFSLFRLARLIRYGLILVLVVLVSILGTRVYDALTGPPLAPWHTFVPDEARAEAIDRMDWGDYLAAEEVVFAAVRDNVTRALAPEHQVAENRYFEGSPLYPGRFAEDWNRSYILKPDGPPVGAAVFLHGLTDTPYSLRHISRRYRERGFIAVAPRMPGHGTVPAGLTEVDWQDWLAATRLAVREARRLAGPDVPLHLVGFSNGGALALKYAMDALEDETLVRPQRIVLISPMIGITRFARFAGIAGWPAVVPAFVRSAWLDTLPEFNPFKYNSFPVNGAVQSYLLTTRLQARLLALAASGRNRQLPPILGFQSVLDDTVSSHAVVHDLFEKLPANGSALVLLDINRANLLGPLFTTSAAHALDILHDGRPQTYRVDVIGNADPHTLGVAERRYDAGSERAIERALPLAFPAEVYSLSHVALPFACDDPLYGLAPRPDEDYGIRLGTLALRGERSALLVGADQFNRLGCNPFFDYLVERIMLTLPAAVPAPAPVAASAPAP